jgi:DNA-directed RNA polymerase specialized sigma24 family protein
MRAHKAIGPAEMAMAGRGGRRAIRKYGVPGPWLDWEDLAQEAVVAYWLAIMTGEGVLRPAAYMAAAASRVLLNVRRKRSPRMSEWPAAFEPAARAVPPALDSADEVEAMRRAAHRAGAAPARLFEVIAEEPGREKREIAEALGVHRDVRLRLTGRLAKALRSVTEIE